MAGDDREAVIRNNYETVFNSPAGKVVLADLVRYARFAGDGEAKLVNYIQWQLTRRFDLLEGNHE